ncbi:MAG TPA: hypothetical protein VKV24_11570 [Casimicrobiaceae bacterium]|nr:hypothetical protein [Casimicrobiaceae bacterium]
MPQVSHARHELGMSAVQGSRGLSGRGCHVIMSAVNRPRCSLAIVDDRQTGAALR